MIVEDLGEDKHGIKRLQIELESHSIDEVIETLTTIRERYRNRLRVDSTDIEVGGGIRVYDDGVQILIVD